MAGKEQEEGTDQEGRETDLTERPQALKKVTKASL